jgi:hypothetical protein
MFIVKYRQGNQFVIEKYDFADWRDHRAARLITLGFVVTLSKVRA